jgi:hypothetical protein
MSGIIAQNTLDNSGLIKSPAGGGAWNFIKKLTADGSSGTLSFVDGASDVDLSTYKEYIFTFNNIHPATDNASFHFNLSIDTGSNYNVAKTSSSFRQQHAEDDASTELAYDAALGLAQGTGGQKLADSGNDSDQALSGYIHLFDPSSTTFIKHYIATSNGSRWNDLQQQYFISGYANTTSAVDAVRFQMSPGNMDAGDICLYGISS